MFVGRKIDTDAERNSKPWRWTFLTKYTYARIFLNHYPNTRLYNVLKKFDTVEHTIQHRIANLGERGSPARSRNTHKDTFSRIRYAAIFSLMPLVCAEGQMVFAQEPPVVAPAPPNVTSTEDILTLDDVLRTTTANYPRILAVDAERRAASARRREKQGAFDITTGVGSDFLRYNTSTSRGKEYTYTTNNASVEMLTRSGVKIIAGRDFNSGVVKSPLSSTGNSGTYYAGVKVPLLRGLGVNEKMVAERQAILGIPVADQNYNAVRLSTMLSASRTYWDWVASGQKRVVSLDLLRLAELRASQIRRENEVGAQPDIAVVEADQEVQRRRGALGQAERSLQKAAFALAAYLWNPDGTPAGVPAPELVPPTMPLPAALAEDQIAAARERAVTSRPEIGVLSLQREITQWDLNLAQNDTKPDVSIVLQPGQDLGRLGIGDTMKAGISFSLPLNRWEATGRRDVARARIERIDQDRDLLRRQVVLEVDDAASAVNIAEERYRAAQLEVDLAIRLEEGERTRFRAGDSTLFLVNQRERATAEARTRLIDVQAEYQQAIAAFRAASVQF